MFLPTVSGGSLWAHIQSMWKRENRENIISSIFFCLSNISISVIMLVDQCVCVCTHTCVLLYTQVFPCCTHQETDHGLVEIWLRFQNFSEIKRYAICVTFLGWARAHQYFFSRTCEQPHQVKYIQTVGHHTKFIFIMSNKQVMKKNLFLTH